MQHLNKTFSLIFCLSEENGVQHTSIIILQNQIHFFLVELETGKTTEVTWCDMRYTIYSERKKICGKTENLILHERLHFVRFN